MTNYGNSSTEFLTELWNDICKKHWNYLETEESLEKIEERVKLETCLTDYLCLVPHDRKFLLPETNHVLKKSILYMQDFSAYKACIGFESISQYANNLFTKPWRKEYKIIKMYSGFFQHEIRTNLLDAERLFEAMGYKMHQNQSLILDGAICPDQVTNVSRDAMAAYVECQIIKQIYSGLTSMHLSCSWLDIYNFREHHVGTASQAIKLIAYTIQEKQYRKNVISNENCYNQVSPVSPTTYNQCAVHPCNQCSKQQLHYQVPYLNPSCSLHSQTQHNMYGYQTQMAPIPHSKSLDQYDPSGIMGANLPHRHSFDHPYGQTSQVPLAPPPPPSNFDCVDGSHASCNFNAFTNHPYNVSGNRFPLPYNLSSGLNNTGYAIPNGHVNKGYAVPNTNCYPQSHHPNDYFPPRVGGYYSAAPGVQQHTASQQTQYPLPVVLGHDNNVNNKYSSVASQADVGQLIDLVDPKPPPIYPTSILKKGGQHISNNSNNILMNSNGNINPNNKRYKDLLSGDQVPFEKTSRHSDFDSYEDDNSKSTAKSSLQASKEKEGIGSYESWNYVFQNLEKQGYSKDLAQRHHDEEEIDVDDLGVDINKLNIHIGDMDRQHKRTLPEIPTTSSSNNTKQVKHRTSNNQIATTQQQQHKANGTVKKSTTNQWSCRFCTFLNDEALKICEMCAKSRDFNLDGGSTKAQTATCV